MKFASAFVAAAAAAHQDALDLLDILGLEDSVVDFFDEKALDFALVGTEEEEEEEDEAAAAADAAEEEDEAAAEEDEAAGGDAAAAEEEDEESEESRAPPTVIATAAAIATEVEAVNFVITNTIGTAASAAPIVGADETTALSAEAGMDFAVVFETADSTMSWVESLTYTGGSASFLSQQAIAAAVADTSTGGSAIYKFLASYLVDSPLTNTAALAADLSFTFTGTLPALSYEYLYQFTIGAVDQTLPGMAVNTLVIGDPVVVVVEESSSAGFPWLWVILGIIIVGAILYFFVL